MGVDATIDITPEERQTVLALLQRHLPGTAAWVYGSRAKWTSTPTSDLDLVVFATPEQQPQVGDLREAFEESNLPFRVDLFVWDDVPESFRQRIEADKAPLVGKGAGDGRTVRVAATGRRDPDGWRIRRFEELLDEPVRNGIYKSKEHHGHGVKIVNMGELFAHPRLRAVSMRRVGLSESEIERFSITRGDLLFARRSLVAEGAGKCSVVLDVDEPTAFESSIIRARPAAATSDPLYLYYFFSSPQGLHRLDTIRRQVAVAGITGKDLSGLEIPAPPLSEQRAIAHVLGTLDDKIELNRRMNVTLEAMVRALFRSWFVDFDPVRAKMEGRDTGLPKEVADLFPDRLVDSELGEMPEGWEVSEIGAEVDAVGGATPSTKEPAYWDGGRHHWATPKDLSKLLSPVLLETERKITDVGAQKISSPLLPRGTVILSSRAPIGYLAITEVPTAINQGFIAMICRKRLPALYVLSWCYENLEHIKDISGGSTLAEIGKKAFRPLPVAVPPKTVLGVYDATSTSLHERVVSNTRESALLGSLRDALLPKLVSGDVRIHPSEHCYLTSAI